MLGILLPGTTDMNILREGLLDDLEERETRRDTSPV